MPCALHRPVVRSAYNWSRLTIRSVSVSPIMVSGYLRKNCHTFLTASIASVAASKARSASTAGSTKAQPSPSVSPRPDSLPIAYGRAGGCCQRPVVVPLLTHMRPEQVQDAVRRDVPVLMAAGCVEYHGPHLPIGTDTLIASAVCERAERRAECVLMPPLAMAPTMAWARGPEEGEIDFDPEVFFVSVASTSYSTIRVPTGWSPYASSGQQGRSYGRPCTSGGQVGGAPKIIPRQTSLAGSR